jgi:polysaccharide deacetylase family sporulation protein PdaB
MRKLLVLISVCLMFVTGCGSDQHNMKETNYFQGVEMKETAAPNHSQALPLSITEIQPFAIVNVTPAPTPLPTVIPEPTPKPTAQAQPPKATPKAKTKLSQKEVSKKPSVPVNQNQEKNKVNAKQQALSLSELVKKYPTFFKLHGSTSEKKVALTFDDGPDERFTPKILDILKANNVKATFFIVGKRANEDPELVKRIVREGHVIGNHSFSHANLPKLDEKQFEEQIRSSEAAIKQLIGYAPKLIRPPYGAINEEQVKWVSEHNYVIVNWNVDSLDWKSLGSEQVLTNVMKQTRPGSIILQHSGGAASQDLSGTVEALPSIISKLKANGYEMVTIPELLHVPKSK